MSRINIPSSSSGGGSATPAQKQRTNPIGLDGYYVVGTRPPTAYVATASGGPGMNGRLKDYLACDALDLRTLHSTPLPLELDGTGNRVQNEQGIEPTIGGTILPVTFGGKAQAEFDANGMVVSDPIPGYWTKGPLWHRTWSSNANAVVGSWTTVSGSATVTINSVSYGDVERFKIGSIIYGNGVTGFANTIVSIDATRKTLILATAASSSTTATFFSNLGTGQVISKGYVDAQEYGANATTNTNLSKSGAITSATGNSTGPTLLLGRIPSGQRPPSCWGLFGDSLTAGIGWAESDYASRLGMSFAAIAMSAGGAAGSSTALYDTPYINFGKGSEKASEFATLANSYRRRRLIGFCTHATVQYGINDLGAGASQATLQASLISVWSLLSTTYGIKVWACTIGPKTSSTDSWATVVNQTNSMTGPGSAARIATNDWIRDGAPILAGVAVATGSNAAGTLRTGAAGHPLSGYFDTADQWETSRNSGIWKAGTVFTTDGLGVHPNNAGHLAGATAIDRTVAPLDVLT